VRSWRPENERADVDAIIREARAAGIECAQWEAGSIEVISATTVDGAATQGFLLVSPAGRKKRILSILTNGAIADAWTGEPESRRQIEATLASSGMAAPTLAVSRSYLDRIVAHHLALGVEKGEVPPPGLLEVAEARRLATIGYVFQRNASRADQRGPEDYVGACGGYIGAAGER
jgi:hypothetical protein